MNAQRKPSRMGRPPLHPEEGARIGHSLRLKPSVDQAVREAAEKNSRSLAEEMEHRINKSFENESDIEKTIEYRVNKKTEMISLKFELEKCSYEWKQAVDTKFLCNVYKIDLIHKGGLIRRLQLALGNRLIRLVSIEGDRTKINLRELDDKEKMSQAKIDYWKERYTQIASELTSKLSNDKDARSSISEEDALKIIYSDMKLKHEDVL